VGNAGKTASAKPIVGPQEGPRSLQ